MDPRIAIIGSAAPGRDYEPPLSGVDISSAARDLGRHLAEAGCRLVVYSSDDDFIERDVVAGFVESGRASAGSVEIHGKAGQVSAFPGSDLATKYFLAYPQSSPHWEVAFYASLLEVDGMILIGGGRSTFTAGVLGLSRKIAVTPLAAFGGAARRVWDRLDSRSGVATEDEIGLWAEPWRSNSAAAVAASVISQCRRIRERADQARRAERAVQRRRTISLLATLAMLAAGIATIPAVYTVRAGSGPGVTLLVFAPLLMAISGSLIADIRGDGRDWVRAAVVGAGAGMVAALLFVGAQITTNPAILTAQDSVRRLIVFILAVGFVGGYTSERVYAKLSEQDVTPVAPLQAPDASV